MVEIYSERSKSKSSAKEKKKKKQEFDGEISGLLLALYKQS